MMWLGTVVKFNVTMSTLYLYWLQRGIQ